MPETDELSVRSGRFRTTRFPGVVGGGLDTSIAGVSTPTRAASTPLPIPIGNSGLRDTPVDGPGGVDQASAPGMNDQLSALSMSIASGIFGAAVPGAGLAFGLAKSFGPGGAFSEAAPPGGAAAIGNPNEQGGIGGPANADDTAGHGSPGGAASVGNPGVAGGIGGPANADDTAGSPDDPDAPGEEGDDGGTGGPI